MNDWKLAMDFAVVAAAVVGMVLGIVNFVRQLWSDRVKVRVVPLAAHYQGRGHDGDDVYLTNSESFLRENNPPEAIGFRVTNLSLFPVTIRDIGFKPRRSRRRHSIYSPGSDSNDPWPRKMEPRTSATFYTRLTNVMEAVDITKLGSAYVSTDCGSTFRGKSRALKQMTKYFNNDT